MINKDTFDCLMCFEKVPLSCGIQLDCCQQLHCAECLKGYVAFKISSKNVTDLACPSIECRLPMQPNDIRSCTWQLGDMTLWHQYEDLATQAFFDSVMTNTSDAADKTVESLRRCPTERCNFIFQFEPDPDTGTLFICPDCDNSFCLHCPVVDFKVGPSHDGGCRSTLKSVQASREKKSKLEEWKKLNQLADSRFNDLMLSERMRGITKPCPKCQAPITKNGGCEHMQCLKCKTHFSWSSA